MGCHPCSLLCISSQTPRIMQKYLLPLILYFVLVGTSLNAQSIYYVRPNSYQIDDNKYYFGVIDVSTCQDSTIFLINNTSNIAGIYDVAVCPDGTFYFVCGNETFPYEMVGRLNFQDSSIVPIANVLLGNSLTCDGNGVLWGGGVDLYSYDPSFGTYINYGDIGYGLAGDLTFRNGKLYGTTITNDFIEIDPYNLPVTNITYNYPVNEFTFGVVSVANSCDSTTTYISVTNSLSLPQPDTINRIYAIDPILQTTTFVCDMAHGIWGAATLTEHIASDCTIRLNLDPDTSSNAPPTDWQAMPLCAPGTLMLSDTDATYFSGYRTDSIRLRLLLPAPDVPLEYLSAVSNGNVNVSSQGPGWLTFSPVSTTSLVISNAGYQTALRTARWHNDAAIPTPGPRIVEVIAFASGGRTDTAYAYLPVPALLSAGQDTLFAVCEDALPFPLFVPGAAVGGSWAPALSGGLFSPQTDSPGIFSYSIGNGLCPADTAWVSVELLPLPGFSLGQDTSICANEFPLALSAPPSSGWQDGSITGVFSATEPNLYWAEYTDANGCTFRDSIVVSANALLNTSGTAQACYGQSYAYNGQTFNADTTVCVTFSALNGCDSIHCLQLAFYYPALALDTSICSGQVLSWLGTEYASSGFFADTMLLGGCQTATALLLEVRQPDTVSLNVDICEGENYAVNGQVFTLDGLYFVDIQHLDGCDTVLRLDLNVRPAAMESVSAAICPGMGYVFSGDTLHTPGSYTASMQTTEGCDSTVTLTLGLFPVPDPQIFGDTQICNGGATTLSLGAFAAYAWSGGESASAMEVTTPGNYTVTVTSSDGCTASTSAQVFELPPITADLLSGDPLCHGENSGYIELSGLMGGLEPTLFSLNGNVPNDSPFFEGLQSGQWEVLATDAAGCTATFTFSLQDPPVLSVELGPSLELDMGTIYTIQALPSQNGPFSYQWSPTEGIDCSTCPSPVLTAEKDITYVLVLTNASGCTATGSLLLRIKKSENIYVPNVFSPNGDGENDFLPIYGSESISQTVNLFQVYDRWGSLLFERRDFGLNDASSGWDGKCRGKYVLPGVYVWLAELRLSDGSLVKKSGEVTVVR